MMMHELNLRVKFPRNDGNAYNKLDILLYRIIQDAQMCTNIKVYIYKVSDGSEFSPKSARRNYAELLSQKTENK
jgi:hypothetical protein